MQQAKFDAVDLTQWQARAEKELRGVPLAKLTRSTPEGIDIAPLHATAEGAATTLPVREGVKLVGLVDGPLATPVAAAIAAEAAGGADAVVVDPTGLDSWPARAPGLAINGGGSPATADALRQVVDGRARVMAAIDVARWQDAATATGDVAWLSARAPETGDVVIDLRRFHEAGADAATELGAGLATFIATLRCLDAGGIAPTDAAARALIRVPISSDFLMQTAKLRAWSALVERVLGVAGVDATKRPRVFAESSRRALTRLDPWVNLLRGTVSAFAGIIGGADFIGVQPFDRAARASDDDAMRLARNTVHILVSESHIDEVRDPAAGSFAITTWTTALIARAWGLMQRIEGAGGALSDGGRAVIAASIADAEAARRRTLETRKAALIGTSLYANATEEALAGAPSDLDARLFGPRDSETFERLRAATQAAGHAIFVANVGPLGEQQARSSWVRDLFTVGGYAIRDGGDGFDDGAAASRAFGTAPTAIAVISAADARLPALVPTLAAALKAEGATTVLVAGRPGPDETAWRDAGVDGFVFAGMNIVELFEGLRPNGEE